MNQAGVRTIAVGGRPTTGPMQTSSGSRGARVYTTAALDEDFDFVSHTIQNEVAAALLPDRSDTGVFVTSAGFNIRDQVRANDSTPLQFKYEAADCRIYHTLDNVWNMTRLWRDAAKATWEDPSLCVSGSTGFPSARNTTSSQAPPKGTTRVPSLNLEHINSLDPAENEMADFQASNTIKTSEITLCDANGSCARGRQCKPTPLNCGTVMNGYQYDKWVQVFARLPRCSSHDPYKCPGDSDCIFSEITTRSKLNTIGAKGTIEMQKGFREGLCVPRTPSRKLPCPLS
jgi:hypothetical protein